MKQQTTTTNIQSAKIFRGAYFLYLVLVVFQLCTGEFDWAVTNLGIALVFDPFDASVKWEHRTLYQKVWLLVHLALVLTGFAFMAFR